LADFTVADADGDNLSVTLTPTNGTLGNVVDADAATAGIQLTGTAASINTALANATFTPTAAGAASIGISLSDGVRQGTRCDLPPSRCRWLRKLPQFGGYCMTKLS
jgi:hypothetical protein